MSLKDYLCRYFPTGINGTYEHESVNLVDHMLSKFGVNVKSVGNLFLFKYNQLEAKFTFSITQECRGVIYHFNNGSWECVCKPFDKFFNQHEGFSPYFDRNLIKQDINNLCLVEKLDGTCITVWFNPITNAWHTSTLGMINPGEVGDYPGLTFDMLFWKSLGLNSNSLNGILDKSYTYIFELCCSENRIVTKYDTPVVALLGIRNNSNGMYLDTHTQSAIIDSIINLGGKNIRLPFRTEFFTENITDYESLVLWVETQATNTMFGDMAEGFVAYDAFKPVFKLKNQRYLSLHSVGGGDLKHTRNVVIKCFFAETIDDIMPVLNDSMQHFLESLKFKVQQLLKQVHDASKEIVGIQFTSQKEYALTVQKHIPKQFHSFFFQNKDKISDPKCDLDAMFRYWLKLNHERFEDFWKTA